ncbi:restriction endonuclease subunit S [Clostridium butyricum]|uniref:restriction endonuclease subunit S n=1 Tax=Clostridium butyricum TaxID=1492 RepID=UPI00374F75B6
MEYVKLRKYIELISGRDLTKAQYNDKNNGIPYIMGASNMNNGKLNIERWTNEPTVIGEKGDLIISVKGTVGELLILEEEKVHLSRQVMAIRPKEGYDVKFVFYYMKYYLDRLKEKAKGMIPGVTREDILEAEFIEVSSEEQQRIIKILDKAQELIDKRKGQIEALDELVKSRFIEMFGNPFDTTKWILKKLKEVSISISDGSNVDKKYYQERGEVLFLRIQNVWCNEFRLEDSVYISEDVNQDYIDTSLRTGDLLITKIGRFYTKDSSLGRVSLYLGENDKANYSNNIMRVRLKDEVLSEYVNTLLNLDDYNQYIRRVSVGGTDKRALSKTLIGDFPIIVPPIELQKNFIDFVKQVDKLKFKMEKSLRELENNFNSLMQRTFKGESKI